MYHSYFGIEDQVFSIAVNPRYMYMSAQHREALAHLLYGVKSGGFVMLTGEVGTGKNTTIRCLLEQLPANADVAIIMNPAANARDLMCSLCDEFGVAYIADETSVKTLTDALYAFLLANHAKGRNSIVLIDEAQLLRIATLEQIRLLTNLESHTQKMLQIILVGQPELNDLLAKPALRQLSQRITARYHLRPLNLDETAAYIRHRLTVAGMPPGRDPFPAPVVKKVHSISGGIPRLVNILCDRMLLGAYTRDSTQVDQRICRQATDEVLGDPREKQFQMIARMRSPLWYAGSAAFAALVLSSGLWWWLSPSQQPAPAPEAAPVSIAAASSAPEWGERDSEAALLRLFAHLGVTAKPGLSPCVGIRGSDWECDTLEARTWDDFREYDQPAVLSLASPSRQARYVTLIALEAEQAWIEDAEGRRSVSLDDLGTQWTGEYVMVWKKPPGFDEPYGLGSSGPKVSWLAERFARLDQKPQPLAEHSFNRALQQRLSLFQESQSLTVTGLADRKTLMRLSALLGESKTLAFSAAEAVE
jgi:general secretion pathway protein A